MDGDEHENSLYHCALSAGADLYSLRPERFSQLHPSAAAAEPACDPIFRRYQCVSFCRVLLRGAAALTVLAAELYNILAFHLTLAPASIAPALVASVLWVLVFLQYRASFKDVLAPKPAVQE